MPRPRIADLQQTIEELMQRLVTQGEECEDWRTKAKAAEERFNALQGDVSNLANELARYKTRAHRAEEQVVKLLCALEGKK